METMITDGLKGTVNTLKQYPVPLQWDLST